jgi:hypothetical protein
MYRLQIHIPTPLGDIVRMTDFIAEPGAAPANFTYSRHGDFAPKVVEASVYQLQPGTRNRSKGSVQLCYIT